MTYIEHLEAQDIKATKYILGDATEDGHTHIFYLRDDLPVATSSESFEGRLHHAHAIYPGPNKTLVASIGDYPLHTHTKFTIVTE